MLRRPSLLVYLSGIIWRKQGYKITDLLGLSTYRKQSAYCRNFLRLLYGIFPRGNGFSISTGIGVLGCQVNGMKLEYSGPPRS